MVTHDPNRDQQKQRVYDAENSLAEYWARDLGADADVRAAQRYVNKITRSPWTVRKFGRFEITCRAFENNGRGAHAHGGSRRIDLARRAVTRHVLLHEIAHCLVYRTDDPGHGWRFAAAELALVRHFLGVAQYQKLRGAFKAHRVRYSKPRKAAPGSVRALRANAGNMDGLRRYNEKRKAAKLAAANPGAARTVSAPGPLDMALARANGG